MQPEGMVHALEEIHRLLKPGGILVDIHPFVEAPQVEVQKAGRVVFSRPYPDNDIPDLQAAEQALAEVVRRELFRIEKRLSFHFLVYASSIQELDEYFKIVNSHEGDPEYESDIQKEAAFVSSVETALHDAGEGAQVATHERV